MTTTEFEHQKQLWPALSSSGWKSTGATGYGDVWWRMQLNLIRHEELTASVQIGLKVGPSWARYFVETKCPYPDSGDTISLELDPKMAQIEEIQTAAMAAARRNLADRAEAIRIEADQVLG